MDSDPVPSSTPEAPEVVEDAPAPAIGPGDPSQGNRVPGTSGESSSAFEKMRGRFIACLVSVM